MFKEKVAKTPMTTFSKLTRNTMSAFKKDPLVKLGTKLLGRQPRPLMERATKVISGETRLRKVTRSVPFKTFRKLGMFGALTTGAVAMLGIGLMKGVSNASQAIIAERQIQDQRYARNITMMSRLGYTTGTNRLDRYNHTVGLSQALSANRHGRGAY